ncbi:MAG TPA: winged helix-turn-helix domain-containing protein [Pyrinomonadaceae bacterium]
MAAVRYRFDNFELDVSRRRLLRDGDVIALNPKAFDMLRVLVEHNGELLTKDDLLRFVWNGQFVEEANLTVNMSAIRRALGENAKEPRYITTVSGRGYYFTASITEVPDDLVVESRTLSRLVIEEEAEADEEPEQLALPPVPRSLWRNPVTYLIAALLVTAGAGVAWYLSRPSPKPFEKMSMTRLTTSGRVTMADISPDGKLFAYSHQEPDGRNGMRLEHVDGSGQIELRPLADVVFTNIAFTPDGRQIYYSITGNDREPSGLYRLPAFGGAPEFVSDTRARIVFSPDSKSIAFIRSDRERGRSSLFIADSSMNDQRELVSRDDGLPFVQSAIDWSPNGDRLVVAAVVDETTRAQELFLVQTADGSIQQLTTSNWDGIRAVAWREDGVIASAGDQDVGWETQVWHISLTGGQPQKIVSDVNAYGLVSNLSRDGRSLITVQAVYQSNIWVAPSDNFSAARQVTFDMFGRQSGWDGLAWLPGDRLVFTSYVNRSETLWSMDLAGGASKQIIPDGKRNIYVSASIDGRRITFASNRTGTFEIWIANSDGTNMRQVTTGGNNHTPHISPDGRYIIYNSAAADSTGLWRISTDGGQPIQLTKFAVSWAQHSPDGRFIAGSFNDGGTTRVGVFTADGGEILKTFDVPPRANFRLGIHWTPDGSAITYRDWGYGIWRQGIDGGAPARLEGLPQEKIYAYAWSNDGSKFAFTRGMEIRDVVLISEEDQ